MLENGFLLNRGPKKRGETVGRRRKNAVKSGKSVGSGNRNYSPSAKKGKHFGRLSISPELALELLLHKSQADSAFLLFRGMRG
jgi:hypothetical protein